MVDDRHLAQPQIQLLRRLCWRLSACCVCWVEYEATKWLTVVPLTIDLLLAALLGLKAALAPGDAAQLTGWQPGTDPCQGWKGVYCNTGNRVYVVDLSDLGLSGTLSDSVDFSLVTQLQSLWLHGNRLTGTLPSSLSQLQKLSDLKVYDNQLSGTLPAALAGATRLKQLFLNSNRFSGLLPDAWSSLVNLEQLFLDSNALAGTVPSSWSNLEKLRLL